MFGSSLFGDIVFGDIAKVVFVPLAYWTELCQDTNSWSVLAAPENIFTTITLNSTDWQDIPGDQVTIKRC